MSEGGGSDHAAEICVGELVAGCRVWRAPSKDLLDDLEAVAVGDVAAVLHLDGELAAPAGSEGADALIAIGGVAVDEIAGGVVDEEVKIGIAVAADVDHHTFTGVEGLAEDCRLRGP